MKIVDKKYHYLYKTTNIVNGKYYYGIHSTNNLKDGYLGSGKKLRYSIRKYGKDNFVKEILQFFDNRNDLAQAEINLITRDMLNNKMCMNINFGGDGGSLGMVTVRDNTGKCFNVPIDDPKYLSGELVGVTKGKITVKDKNGNISKVYINDERYLSGELVGVIKGKVNVKDNNGNILHVSIDDHRYLSGELIAIAKNKVPVKDNNGNIILISKNDPKYLSGELKHHSYGKKISEETKKKISESAKGLQVGEKNGSFGTCWITNQIENKKIKKEDLDSYLELGWAKGRINNYLANSL